MPMKVKESCPLRHHRHHHHHPAVTVVKEEEEGRPAAVSEMSHTMSPVTAASGLFCHGVPHTAVAQRPPDKGVCHDNEQWEWKAACHLSLVVFLQTSRVTAGAAPIYPACQPHPNQPCCLLRGPEGYGSCQEEYATWTISSG